MKMEVYNKIIEVISFLSSRVLISVGMAVDEGLKTFSAVKMNV